MTSTPKGGNAAGGGGENDNIRAILANDKLFLVVSGGHRINGGDDDFVGVGGGGGGGDVNGCRNNGPYRVDRRRATHNEAGADHLMEPRVSVSEAVSGDRSSPCF